jgi:hypothetical protein
VAPPGLGETVSNLGGADSSALLEVDAATEQSQHNDEKRRHEKDRQDRSRQHAADHGTADRILSAGAGSIRDSERKDPNNER